MGIVAVNEGVGNERPSERGKGPVRTTLQKSDCKFCRVGRIGPSLPPIDPVRTPSQSGFAFVPILQFPHTMTLTRLEV